MQKAFNSLKSSGLLELKNTDVHADEGHEEVENDIETSRIAKPVNEQPTTVPAKRRAASGLSSRGRTSAPMARTTGPAQDDDLFAMPISKLRELKNQRR